MSDEPFMHFGKYKLFAAEPSDYATAKAWTDADPFHAGRVDPSFWLKRAPGIESYLLYDETGPVYFARLQRIYHEHAEPSPDEKLIPPVIYAGLELHIQFAPPSQVSTHRTAQALNDGLEWLIKTLTTDDRTALMRFDSQHSRLTAFACERLGFVEQDGHLIKWLLPHPPPGQQTQGTSSGQEA